MVLGCHDGYTTRSSVASIVADARLIGLGLLTMMQEARLHLAGGRVTSLGAKRAGSRRRWLWV